jgi:hypothetical protein
MGERDQRTGVTGRRARLRHFVVRGEALLAAALLLVLVGPFEVPPHAAHLDLVASTVARATRVAVIGDSLVSESRNEQRDELTGRRYEVVVAGSRGKAMSNQWIQEQVTGAAADPTIDVVVLATAANDNFGNSARAAEVGDARALAEYRRLLRSTLARLGDRCVVLVDARDVTVDWFAPAYAGKSNAVLREVTASRPHTEVVAWSDISRPHGRHWFALDMEHFGGRGRQIHPTGAVAYADAIADGVDRCRTS